MEIDPSIVNLFEEDEDETMHSGADVEAFQAALNHDVEGHASTSQPPLSNTVLSQGSNQTGAQDGKAINFHSQQALQSAQQPEKKFIPQQQPNDVPKELNCLWVQQKQSQDAGQITGQVSQTTGMPISQRNDILAPVSDSESQCLKLQKMGNQQTSGAVLMPTLLPQLDKDSAILLHTLYTKLQEDEITKDIVGNEKLRLTVNKVASQTSAQENNPRKPSFTAGISQFTGPHSFAQLPKKILNSPANSSHASSSVVSVLTDSSYPSIDNNGQNSREMDHQSDSCSGVLGSQIFFSSSSAVNQERDCPSIPGQGLDKQQQQHLASYSASDANTTGSSLKSQPLDSQTRQLTLHQSIGSTPVGELTQAMNMMSGAKFERQNSINDPTRLQGGSLSHISINPVHCQVSTSKELKSSPLSPMTYIKQKYVDHDAQLQYKSHLSIPQGPSIAQVVQGNVIPATAKDKPLEKQLINSGFTTTNNMMPMNSVSPSSSSQLNRIAPNPSVTSPAGVDARMPQRKPSVGQKKQLEALGSSPPLQLCKKQKVSRPFSNQSIEQLNDVTTFSGVNLQEEVERLLSGPKDGRVSEAARRVVHEEEERGILLRTPLQKKLTEIMAEHGLKNISNDVERCLSLSVEERMRGLICNLIRLSKQRTDAEKPMHLKLITSDVRKQIIRLNRNAKEEWEKKQVEVEKLQKLDESEGSRVNGDKEKDAGQVKSVKTNKEDYDKMMATAANVAARVAVGGDDMFSKWQHMAEQARQKRERGIDAASSCQEAEKRGLHSPLASGAIRKFGQNQVPQIGVARTISVKDVIAVLEREPQMSRSKLIYLLYERIHPMAAA